MTSTILIRADGSAIIGFGHIVRCVALAQAWRREGGTVVVAMAESTRTLDEWLEREGLLRLQVDAHPGSADDAERTLALAHANDAVWVALDGYAFGADYQFAIKSSGRKVLVLDDYGHAAHYCADVVLNQNLGAAASLYEHRDPDTQLLLGPTFALLRTLFADWQCWERKISLVARKVLVTLGGGDRDDITARVVAALGDLDVEAKVVVSTNNGQRESLSSIVRSPHTIVRDATNMPELMAWADVAIAAGGSTSWELAFMALPSLVLVLADNQRAIATALDAAAISRKTIIEHIGSDLAGLVADPGARRSMSQRGRELVDGRGAQRVTDTMRSKADRDVENRDCFR